MDAKDIALIISVAAAFVSIAAAFAQSIINLVYNLRATSRSVYVNSVTAERTKWIGKVRGNVSHLVKLCHAIAYPMRQIITNPEGKQEAIKRNHDTILEAEELATEIRLQLNPQEDAAIEKLLIERAPKRDQPFEEKHFAEFKEALTVATQAMLKREWEKVKNETRYGDLRKAQKRRS